MMRILFLICLIFCITNPVFSQTEGESAPGLILIKNDDSTHAHFMRSGKHIVVYVEESGRMQRYGGTLSDVTDSTFRAGEEVFFMDEVEKVRGRSAGMLATNIVGGIITGLGVVLDVFGFAFVISGSRSGDPWSAFFLILFGILFIGAGIPITLLGAIPLLIRGKTYRMSRGWRIRKGFREVKKKADKSQHHE